MGTNSVFAPYTSIKTNILFFEKGKSTKEVWYYEVQLPERVKAFNKTKPMKLGIACEPEDGRAYFLMPRSSISKAPLRLANSLGLIDGGYRGELMAMCDNIKAESYTVEKGQRLFQVVACDCSPIFYEMVEELSETSRGTVGFGSTGK